MLRRTPWPLLTGLLLCGCLRPSGARLPILTAPAYDSPAPYLSLPPAFEDRLLYYNAFELPDGAPEICDRRLAQPVKLETRADGARGRCAMTGTGKELQLRSDAFSPHLPLTVSFWWALQQDAKADGGFGLVQLSGKQGYVSHFSRGKGEWCALRRPAGILQVYHFPGIQNVNGIYDDDWMAHLDLKAGAWHHTALAFNGASLVEVYTDGRLAWKVRLRGRPFRSDDQLHSLSIGTRSGTAMAIDEVLVLRRALAAGEIADYVAALRHMREVGYPDR